MRIAILQRDLAQRNLIETTLTGCGHTCVPFDDCLMLANALAATAVDLLVLDWYGALPSDVELLTTLRARGIGRTLLRALIERCESGPWRQMVAVIADPQGGSPALHRSVGFELVGTLRAVGFKHGQWRDTLLMQRMLGAGSTTLPDA